MLPKLLCLYFFLAASIHAQGRSIDPPALDQSGMAFLTTGPDGVVYLSWIDPGSDGRHALRFARWTGAAWTEPEQIASGKNWFVNWADFPSLAVLPDGAMLAHWLTRSPTGGKFGYGIRVARRAPGAHEWREIHGMSLHEPEDYAGFLSFAPRNPAAVYLSPPPAAVHASTAAHHESGHRKTVRYISFLPDGRLESDREIDADVCSCCQTAIAQTRKGLLVAYRDHQPGEVRDISILRFSDGAWSQPETLHRDGWVINGCPTEGPSAAARGDEVGIAWLTRANDRPRLQVKLSHDAGVTFHPPIQIDGGNPLGRPSLALFDSTSYLAVWLEKTTAGKASIRLRRIGFDGRLQEPFTVAQAAAGRSTGFPKVAVTGNQIIVTWRDERVRAALIPKSQWTGQNFK